MYELSKWPKRPMRDALCSRAGSPHVYLFILVTTRPYESQIDVQGRVKRATELTPHAPRSSQQLHLPPNEAFDFLFSATSSSPSEPNVAAVVGSQGHSHSKR